jgi:hypothetical protein
MDYRAIIRVPTAEEELGYAGFEGGFPDEASDVFWE